MTQPISSIHVLDSHTANQIAAGEVVERPLSVVKELVENAIDAGASRITVRLYDCGCEKIKVTDNGCGMSPEDMRLAIQRHATSKINTAADLSNLHSLGFRGEALPSIASVSLMCITSKQAERDVAYRMSIRDGKASLPEECSASNGTTIEVDELFYNAPARKKFLKTPRTELGLISDYVGRMAICHRNIAFTLMNGNHRIIVTAGNGNLEAAVIAVFGRQISGQLMKVENEDHSIYGLLSLPALTRSTHNNTFFVNGRLVRSRELAQAVDRGYHTLIPEKRYPFTVLFFDLPPDSIDVNVHPSKLEIKLHNPQPLEDSIVELIGRSLNKNKFSAPKFGLGNSKQKDEAYFYSQDVRYTQRNQSGGGTRPAGERKPLHGDQLYKALISNGVHQEGQVDSTLEAKNAVIRKKLWQIVEDQNAERKDPPVGLQVLPGKKPETEPAQDAVVTQPQDALQQQKARKPKYQPMGEAPIPQQGGLPFLRDRQMTLQYNNPQRRMEAAFLDDRHLEKSKLVFSALQPIGQFAGTFILASAEDVLYIIDQHAAAERIRYEKILEAVQRAENVVEMLAVPLQLELSHRNHLLLTDHILELRDLGFILELFGENSYVIRGVPSWLGEKDPQQLIQDYLDFTRIHDGEQQLKLRRQELFYMACRSSLKGNRYLSNGDISALFRELDACKESTTCPHGRPIALRLTLEDIYKHFLRGSI